MAVHDVPAATADIYDPTSGSWDMYLHGGTTALSTSDGYDTYVETQGWDHELTLPPDTTDPWTRCVEVTFAPTVVPDAEVLLIVELATGGINGVVRTVYTDSTGTDRLHSFSFPDNDRTWGQYATVLPDVTAAMVAAGTVGYQGGPMLLAATAAGLYNFDLTYVGLRVLTNPGQLIAPPRRLSQRGDGLAGGASRLTGARSRQASNRLLGGYT